MPVHVPQDSTVVITCTTANSSFSPFWTVDLANDSSTQLQFSSKSDELNAHGVYELPQMEIPETNLITLRLLINNTAVNNQTVIHCDRGSDSIQTTLYHAAGRYQNKIRIIDIRHKPDGIYMF